jgi:hypothetical protein
VKISKINDGTGECPATFDKNAVAITDAERDANTEEQA